MPLAVFTTLDDARAAERLARAAIEQGLAACVQIDEIRSLFRWEGSVQDEPEYRLLFKTSDAAWEALSALILKEHPYDEPALWGVPMSHGSEGFLGWIEAETRR